MKSEAMGYSFEIDAQTLTTTAADKLLLSNLIEAQKAQGDMEALNAFNPDDIFYNLSNELASDTSYSASTVQVYTTDQNHADYSSPYTRDYQLQVQAKFVNWPTVVTYKYFLTDGTEETRKQDLNFVIRDNCLDLSYRHIIVENQLDDGSYNRTVENNDGSVDWHPLFEVDVNILSGSPGVK